MHAVVDYSILINNLSKLVPDSHHRIVSPTARRSKTFELLRVLWRKEKAQFRLSASSPIDSNSDFAELVNAAPFNAFIVRNGNARLTMALLYFYLNDRSVDNALLKHPFGGPTLSLILFG